MLICFGTKKQAACSRAGPVDDRLALGAHLGQLCRRPTKVGCVGRATVATAQRPAAGGCAAAPQGHTALAGEPGRRSGSNRCWRRTRLPAPLPRSPAPPAPPASPPRRPTHQSRSCRGRPPGTGRPTGRGCWSSTSAGSWGCTPRRSSRLQAGGRRRGRERAPGRVAREPRWVGERGRQEASAPARQRHLRQP